MTLKRALVRMTEHWPHLPDTKGVSCPVQFTEAEMGGFFEQERLWFDSNKAVKLWQEQVGVSEDGWVSDGGHGGAFQKVTKLKASLIVLAEVDEGDIHLLEKGGCSEIEKKSVDNDKNRVGEISPDRRHGVR